jgi:hypothetical protein
MVLEQICAYFGNPDVSSRAAVTEEKKEKDSEREREGGSQRVNRVVPMSY